jgi:hypothetical protein
MEKSLSELLKEKGLDIAEDAAKLVVEAVLELAEKAAKDSSNKFDDVLLAVLPLLKPVIMDYIDKIDKKVG